jgi:imidazolonepropionase-like amidohydrolase
MKIIGHYIFLGVLIFITSCSSSKSVDFKIADVKLFDGNKVTEHANIYVKKGKIVQIDSSNQTSFLKSKKIIDGKNKTLIPGLINAHCHLSSSNDLKDAAQAGILTMIELFRMQENTIQRFRKLAEKPQYANFFTAGMAADMPNGVFKLYTQQINNLAPKTQKEAVQFIQDRVEQQVDFIKIIFDSRLPEKFSDSLFDVLISETHKNNLLAVVHSELLGDADYEFDHGADIIAHGWIDSLISDETLLKWRSREFYITPTLLIHCKAKKIHNMKSYKLTLEQIIAEIGRLHKAGIPLLAGTDAPAEGINYTTDLYEELALYVEAGLSPLEALKTATSNPAKAYKLKNKGIIQTGLTADFVLIEGDVLSDIKRLNSINHVWKKGIQIR